MPPWHANQYDLTEAHDSCLTQQLQARDSGENISLHEKMFKSEEGQGQIFVVGNAGIRFISLRLQIARRQWVNVTRSMSSFLENVNSVSSWEAESASANSQDPAVSDVSFPGTDIATGAESTGIKLKPLSLNGCSMVDGTWLMYSATF